MTTKLLLHFALDKDITLRVLSEDDAPALFDLVNRNRAHLRQWLPWVDATRTVEDEVQFVRASLQQYEQNNGPTCAIWYRGQIAGTIGYHGIDWTNRKVEIGYWLGEAFQGKGLMTKACRRLITYAFADLGLNRVEIRCAVENKRSRAIPERLGFTQEGICRQAGLLYDHYVDLVLYGLLASEWHKD
ncbi:MAG: GNAT family N-acetyltransferase [Ktedonobacteraceae bacterium]|nr:GNAT family N-acetyltransferase [Ktedonobacteraceae bacterium]